MKILPASTEWHRVRKLYVKLVKQELHAASLQRLMANIEENAVQILIITADIFVIATPGITSQKTYHEFLAKIKIVGCGNVATVKSKLECHRFYKCNQKHIASAKHLWLDQCNIKY